MLHQIFLLIFWISIVQASVPSYFFQLFSFECPKGFSQSGTNCLIPKYDFCRNITELHLLYNIIPKDNDNQENIKHIKNIKNINNIKNSKNYCKYSISKFFEINNSNNSVEIEFASNKDKNEPTDLYLVVTSTQEIKNLEKKIHCYTDRYGKNITEVGIHEIFTSKLETRYSLEIDDSVSRYVCYFLDAGKTKPAFTEPALASTRSKEILISIHQPSCVDDLQNFTAIQSREDVNDDYINKNNIHELFRTVSDLLLPLMCFGLNTKITNDKYCYPTVSGKENDNYWPLTPAMSWTIPDNPCYDDEGNLIRRMCFLNEDGPQWEEITDDYCVLSNDYYEDYAFEDMTQLVSAEVY